MVPILEISLKSVFPVRQLPSVEDFCVLFVGRKNVRSAMRRNLRVKVSQQLAKVFLVKASKVSLLSNCNLSFQNASFVVIIRMEIRRVGVQKV